jgi:hypothetical protein
MMPLTKIAERVQARLADFNAKLQENPVAEAVKENRRGKKPSKAQLRARADFARRARSGEFKGARKTKKTRRALAQNRKMTKRRGQLQENRRRHSKYEENRGRSYAENRGQRQQASAEENQDMAAELEENARKGRKKGKRRAKKRKGGKRRAKRRGGRKRSASRKRPRRKARRTRRTRVVKTHVVTLPRSTVQVQEKKRVRRRRKKGGARRGRKGRRRSRSMMLQENPGLFSGPGPMALYENQAGPFTMASIRAYGVAALGVGIGLIVADVTDRFIATRAPKDGKNPWYGKDAAAAYRRRPDAWRLGGQAGGAVAGMALAYVTRGRGVVPWLLGGIAVGFGSNLVKQLWDWYAAPAILKVDPANAGQPTMGNRLYSLEQGWIQDNVATMFENWKTNTLAPGQQDPPVIASPSPPSAAGPVYTLGRPGQAARSIVRTGRVGTCSDCGCSDGCYSNCPTLCPNCPEFNQNTMCQYTVQPGDDIATFASAGGVSVEQISALNPNTPWTPGARVFLPYGICSAMEKGNFTPSPVAPETQLPVPIETTNIAPPVEALPGAIYGMSSVGNIPDKEYLERAAVFSGANRGQ